MLTTELLARLSPRGWSMIDAAHRDHEVFVALTRTLDSGFEATVAIHGWYMIFGNKLAIRGMEVGVGSELVRELAPLTCRYDLAMTSSPLAPDGTLDIDRDPTGVDDVWNDQDDDESNRAGDSYNLLVGNRTDAVEVARQLADLVIRHGCRIAERYASADHFVEIRGGLAAAALLTANGRLREASEMLEAAQDSDVIDQRSARRCAYQLRRLIDNGGDRTLIPAVAPPPSMRGSGHLPGMTTLLRKFGRVVLGRRAAAKAARNRGCGRSVEEQRAILAEELAGRGMSYTAITVAMEVEHLWDSPAKRGLIGGRDWARIGSLGLKGFRAYRGNEALADEFRQRIGVMDERRLVEAPDPAFFQVPTEPGRYLTATLAPGMEGRVRSIFDVAMWKEAGYAPVLEAWLTRSDGGPVCVHLGDVEIGTIPPAEAGFFEQALEAAEFRGEYVAVEGRMARFSSPPHYIVEVAKPRCW